ncbi:MAG: hypothetical protein M3014_12970, partial [Chloroflexota bacterium]|nr:hypothetical protein [Chloroflexota bacterium]
LDRCDTPLHPGVISTQGYRVQCGKAAVSFLSTEPSANVRGETGDLMLIANEAQDIDPGRWDAAFAPMAASTNAPSAYSGTPWAGGSLLSRQVHMAEQTGTLYRADWQVVAAEVPAYGEYVKGQMRKLGEQHPFIRTEYMLEELNSEGGMLPAARQARMRGEHQRRHEARAGRSYALLLDVAGGDEQASADPLAKARERKCDSSVLTVVEVDLSGLKDPLVGRPAYRVVDRTVWRNEKHSSLLPTLVDLACNVWRASYFVLDATGIGAGLSSLLVAQMKGSRCEVVPFVFSLRSKSDLGWAWLGAIESGRYKEYTDDGAPDTREFWAQCNNLAYTVDDGPGKIMRWSVPPTKGHDDLVLSAGLVGVLEGLEWRSWGVHVRRRDGWE